MKILRPITNLRYDNRFCGRLTAESVGNTYTVARQSIIKIKLRNIK